MTLVPGSRLGPYEIVTSLGAGGMGEDWRAKDTRLSRDVAIKILPEAFSGNPVLIARFEREARSISSLNHPHICTLFDVGSVGGAIPWDAERLLLALRPGATVEYSVFLATGWAEGLRRPR